MTLTLKKNLEELIKIRSKELHEFRIGTKKENLMNELTELRKFIRSENRFNFGKLKIEGFDYVVLTVKWKGSEYGKYHIY